MSKAITNFHRIVKNGNSNTVVIPKEWASVGEIVIVVVKDKNTIIISKNVEIKYEQ